MILSYKIAAGKVTKSLTTDRIPFSDGPAVNLGSTFAILTSNKWIREGLKEKKTVLER